MGEWIIDTITRMGAAGVFLLTLLETVFPPIPSELIMPLAGYLALSGAMGLAAAIVAGTLGSVTGALVLYWAGRRYGRERLLRFAERHGRWLTLTRGDLERAFSWFERRGAWAVLLCRLVPGLRSLISIPAGIGHMPLRMFVACTTLGSAIWTVVLVGLATRWARVSNRWAVRGSGVQSGAGRHRAAVRLARAYAQGAAPRGVTAAWSCTPCNRSGTGHAHAPSLRTMLLSLELLAQSGEPRMRSCRVESIRAGAGPAGAGWC